MTEDRLLTVQEVARRLQVHPETVRRWLRAGKLRAIRLGVADNAGYRIRESELGRFAIENEPAPDAD